MRILFSIVSRSFHHIRDQLKFFDTSMRRRIGPLKRVINPVDNTFVSFDKNPRADIFHFG